MPCVLLHSKSVGSRCPHFVSAGGKMDDITVIVAQVKTVMVPDDEGDDVQEQKGNEQGSASAVPAAQENEE
ncbi:hypothetical protein PR202_gb26345 [Eleusine coracana subsp. coracana]|uniref:Uncharacterized protein n=1 Tax=Eleusine coracana subsp. coracana TaxID=191504 RepID=A0AAV5FP09_ELECO|nr:hypothetical protein PR202_gb26345 [Eleusine coracana subsp. coracana]